ncbi:MAG: antibiotic biosynthesis monooxygenase [Planctomycetes bacterium]|nr:antibiotic biosynthesis monooxygenase [Planctomycetota bacterium]
MINVIATINVKPESLKDFIEIFKANVPNVLAEDGCISYMPTVDLETGLPPQVPMRANTVTIVEAWESLDHLKAHLKAPHMLSYKEKVKDMVDGATSIQVLQPA